MRASSEAMASFPGWAEARTMPCDGLAAGCAARRCLSMPWGVGVGAAGARHEPRDLAAAERFFKPRKDLQAPTRPSRVGRGHHPSQCTDSPTCPVTGVARRNRGRLEPRGPGAARTQHGVLKSSGPALDRGVLAPPGRKRAGAQGRHPACSGDAATIGAGRRGACTTPRVIGAGSRPARQPNRPPSARSLVAQDLQRTAPCDHLVEHVVHGLLVHGGRLEGGEVLEVGEQ